MKLTTTTLLFIFLTATSLMASGYTEEKHPFGWRQGYPLESNFQTSTKPMWGDSEYDSSSQQYIIQSEPPQGEGFHTIPHELWETETQQESELPQWGDTQHTSQYGEIGHSNSLEQGDEEQLFTGNFLKEIEILVGDAPYDYGTNPYEQASHEGGYIQENYQQFYGEQPYYPAPVKIIPIYTIRMSEDETYFTRWDQAGDLFLVEEDNPDFTVTLETEYHPVLKFFELEKTILNTKAVNHREFFILQNPELERLYWFSPDTQFLNSLRSEEESASFSKYLHCSFFPDASSVHIKLNCIHVYWPPPEQEYAYQNNQGY